MYNVSSIVSLTIAFAHMRREISWHPPRSVLPSTADYTMPEMHTNPDLETFIKDVLKVNGKDITWGSTKASSMDLRSQ
jgi:hypothetical protein